jgi:hypothetical protein
MGQQTNIVFYTDILEFPPTAAVEKCLRSFGIREDIVIATKYPTVSSQWNMRFSGKFEDSEYNRVKITFREAVSQFDKEKIVKLSIVKNEEGLANRLKLDIWNTVPKEIAGDCMIGNNDITVGFHDIFGMLSD